jgi:hypothetical protein
MRSMYALEGLLALCNHHGEDWVGKYPIMQKAKVCHEVIMNVENSYKQEQKMAEENKLQPATQCRLPLHCTSR